MITMTMKIEIKLTIGRKTVIMVKIKGLKKMMMMMMMMMIMMMMMMATLMKMRIKNVVLTRFMTKKLILRVQRSDDNCFKRRKWL